MSAALTAHTDFVVTLAEVSSLLDASDEVGPAGQPKERALAAAMNKSALLLLTGKLEACFENIAEEYLYLLCKLRPLAEQLPLQMLIEHASNSAEQLIKKRSVDPPDVLCNKFRSLARVLASLECADALCIPSSFSYGRHGENEVIKLFFRLGVADVFAETVVVYREEHVDAETAIAAVDVKGEFNSLIHLRNNILHRDASPSLTTAQLRKSMTIMQSFIDEIARCLNERLQDISLQRESHSLGFGDAT